MLRRTTVLLASFATAAAGLTVAVPAGAAEEEPAQACRTEFFGVAGNGNLVYRRVDDGRVVNAKRSAKQLSFRATNLAGVGYKKIPGGMRELFVATAADGRPRVLRTVRRAGQKRVAVRVERFRTRTFSPDLFAAGYGAKRVYTVEGRTLKQYTIRRNRRGRLVMANAQVLRARIGRIRTLSWFNRLKIDGRNQNVFLATTASGALKQIRVPVGQPGDLSVRLVKRRGFRPMTGLSLGLCGTGTTGMVLGVMAGRDKARWFTIEDVYEPRAKNVTNRGLAARRQNWRLSPTV